MMIRAFLIVVLFMPSPVLAGAFLGSAGHLVSQCAGSPCSNFIIVHPVGYTVAGVGGEIEVPICIRSGDAPFVESAIVEAIEVWNALTPTTGNCQECETADEPGTPGGVFLMATTALHELGHCAMGLGHSNFQAVGANPDNFTAGTNVTSYDDGTDNIRGSRDDIASPSPTPPPPSALQTHWFRKTDNNPVIIDGTTIDSSTFSVLPIDLPAGSTWPASANRFVSDLLGVGDDTQSVMHATAARDMLYTGLSPDDTNTTRHGMSGLDATASTSDDYTIRLALVDDCLSAEVEVRFDSLDPGELGRCTAELLAIDPPPIPPVGTSTTRYRHSSRCSIGFSWRSAPTRCGT